MWRRALLVLGSLTVLAGLAGGCSGDADSDSDSGPGSGSGSGEVLTDDVKAGLAALYAGDHAQTTDQDSGTCFADELEKRASMSDLQAAGLVTDDGAVATDVPQLPAELATQWVDAQFACVDFVEESARAQVAASKGAIDAEAYATCLRAAITDDQLREAVAQALTGDLTGEAISRLSDAQLDCATA